MESIQDERLNELSKEYGWNLTLYNMCKDPSDIEKIVKMDFGTILTWLELRKADEEISWIQNEHLKKQNKIR